MKFLLGLWHQLWITALVAVLMLALYTSLGRQVIPLVETLRPDLEELISAQLHQPVSIGQISGDWRYLAPIVRFSDVVVGEGESAAQLKLLEFELDVSASAYHLRPVFNRIEATGLELAVQVDDGQWSVAGIQIYDPAHSAQSSSQTPSSPSKRKFDWIHLLELQQRLELKDSRVRVVKDGQLAHRTEIEQLRWRHQGSSQAIRGKLAWGRDKLADVSINAALNGPLWPWADQSGEVVAYIEPQGWSDWIPDELPLGLSVDKLQAGGELWLKVRDGDLSELYGQFSVGDLQASGTGTPIALDNTTLTLGGRHTGSDWHLRLKMDSGNVLPISELTVSSMALEGSRGWQIGLSELDIGRTNRYLTEHGLLPSPFDRYLGNIDPVGRASDVRVSLLKRDSIELDVKADLHQITGQPYAGIPGISGMDATVHLQPHGGLVSVRQQKVDLDLKGVYDEVWPFKEVDGDFYWSIGPDVSHIWLDGVKGRSGNLSLVAAASMELPSRRLANAESRLRLLLSIPKASVLDRDQILPDLLDPELRQWIMDAFSEGDLSNGALLLDGVMEEGRVENSLTTQLMLDLRNTRMSYLEGWPEVQQAKGRFYLDAPDVDVRVDSMATLGGKLEPGTGRIRLTPAAQEGQTHLMVDGKLTGPVSEALAYFHQTPLQEVVNHGFDDWTGQGDLTSEMSLKMLLGENTPEPEVKLRAWLEDDSIQLNGLGLDFSGIQGVLDFDSALGLSSEKLNANLFGGPVEAVLTSTPGEGGFSSKVIAKGRAEVADVRDWMPNVLLAPVSGNLGYDAEFQFDTSNGRIGLDLNTSLDGTLIDYPAPFFKAADDVSQPLYVHMDIASADAEPRIVMNYNDRVRGIFALNETGVDRGQVYLGGLEPYLPSDRGIGIRGEILEPVIAEPWWDKWLELQALSLTPPYLIPSASGASSDASAEDNPVRSVEIKLAKLTAAEIPMPGFTLDASQDMGEWVFNMSSGVVGGQVIIPAAEEEPVQLNLDYLHLPASEDTTEDIPADRVSPEQKLNAILAQDALIDMVPGDLLPMDLNLKEWFLGGYNLGRWKVQSRPIDNGAAIQILDSDMKGLEVTGDIRWLLMDGKHSTHVDVLQVRGSNLAKIQSSFRQDPLLDAKTGRANLNLSWSGSPMAFNSDSLDGVASIRLEKGVWKAEGTGAIRAFGLLNFNSIARRLQLDFSDLYESGVAFDVVRAKAKIEQGKLTLVEPFVSTGPGAKFYMAGSTDLVQETMDMKLAATFPVTSSLPIVAFLAGFAPQVAASIYVTEKLIGNELERFTSASYDVKGNWSDPQMTLRPFDNKVEGKKTKSFKNRVLSIFGLEDSE